VTFQILFSLDVSDEICLMKSEGYICGVGIILKHYGKDISSFYHFDMFLQCRQTWHGLKEKSEG
jgi:hypothetical protein